MAPCSSPGGLSSQTPPQSPRPVPRAVAVALGQSSFGPLCRERITPPAQNSRCLTGGGEKKISREQADNVAKRCNERTPEGQGESKRMRKKGTNCINEMSHHHLLTLPKCQYESFESLG